MNKIISIVIAALILTTPGCSWFSHEASVAKQAAIDCGKQDLGQTVGQAAISLAMMVAATLFEGGTDWQGDLDKLAAQFGPEALACASDIATKLFPPMRSPGPSAFAMSETPAGRAAMSRAKFAAGRALQ